MYEDNNQENQFQNQSPNQSLNQYGYVNEEPKWQPDAEKYNTPVMNESPRKQQKPQKAKKSKWWIAVVAALAVVLAVIIVFGVIAVNTVKSSIKSSSGKTLEFATETTESDDEGDNRLVISEDKESDEDDEVSFVLTDVSEVVDAVMPAVVSITSRTIVNNNSYYNYFNFFFGGNSNTQDQGTEVDSGIGSGTIVGYNDQEILVLTSYHVVEGCSSLYVTFVDGENVDGYIKGAIEESDIAVVGVRIDDVPDDTYEQLRVATLCTEDVKVGEGTIVIGNALGYGQSVSTGVVSAKDRTITVDEKSITVIQTNAAINNGNSGGCMLNSNGDVIGISEAKISSSAVEGMCYAISIYTYYDQIMDILEQPAEDMEEEAAEEEESRTKSTEGSPYLGIYGRDVTSDLASQYNIQEGIYVQSTVSGSGAEAAEIQQGDIIIEFNGKTVATMDELKEELNYCSVGDVVDVVVLRYNGNRYEEVTLKVTLSAAIS